VPQIVAVEAVACDSAHEAAWLERNLLERSKPRWNRARGGAEVPVYIRVDRRPGVARLAVVHGPLDQTAAAADCAADLFGPYLGGTKARLAVSALDRVLPLGYTDDRLSGCQWDLTRVRGIAVADRQALLATVTAVLRRQPDAVQTVRQAPGSAAGPSLSQPRLRTRGPYPARD
jgi:excinuclease UvrABC nuclease subunit